LSIGKIEFTLFVLFLSIGKVFYLATLANSFVFCAR